MPKRKRGITGDAASKRKAIRKRERRVVEIEEERSRRLSTMALYGFQLRIAVLFSSALLSWPRCALSDNRLFLCSSVLRPSLLPTLLPCLVIKLFLFFCFFDLLSCHRLCHV
ncbi:hypothetical protein AVEN_250448-1 [Araneus ventricosus]|uniref:Transmembrane protein n=1 Tax=Araneus ventricosus TaxID=182803 RepID=A0A4Y1ZTX0_ARAVE|nr:hypothetical protein AVEN_250448-1 [Araneus ventricosus]